MKVLVGEGEGGRFAAARVVVSPGGVMAEHDHGESKALVTVQNGRIVIRESGREETPTPGKMASIRVGGKVSLENPSSSEPTSFLAFFHAAGIHKDFRSVAARVADCP